MAANRSNTKKTSYRKTGPSPRSGGNRNPDRSYKVRLEVLVMTAALCLLIGYVGRPLIEGDGSGERRAQTPLFQPVNPGQGTSGAQSTGFFASLLAAVERTPNSAAAWTNLGNAYFDSDQYEPAIDAYKRSIEIEPLDPNVITDMGIMYRRIGRPDEALQAFSEASRIDPSHQMSRFNAGIVLLYDKRDRSGALQAWQELARMNPSFVAPDGSLITELVDSLR